MLKTIMAFLAALPEIIELIKELDRRAKEEKIERKVKDDIKKINQAFKDKDAEALNDLFNS